MPQNISNTDELVFSMRTILSALACSFLLMTVPAPAMAQQPVTKLPTVNMQIGLHLIKVEYASTEDQRATGLMFRKHLDENSGMLFDYNRTATRACMWMKNTFVPLSVAFIDPDGIILNIEDMEPLSLATHCSRGQTRYALEMNQGWFAAKGIGPGSKAVILP